MAEEIVAKYVSDVAKAVADIEKLIKANEELTRKVEAGAKSRATEEEKAAAKAKAASEKAAAAMAAAAKKAEKEQTDAARRAAAAAEREAQKAAAAYERAEAKKAEAARRAAEQARKAAVDAAKAQEAASEKSAQVVINNLKSVAGAIGLAYGADALAGFVKDSVELAGKIEGVKIAFNRLGDPKLLDGLRKSVKGTVSDLELMQFAIKAQNFKIPLEQLGVFLEFARRRAKETGVEMQYMMDSIMTAVGRGSIEVWDNLGISLTEVRSKLNGVSIETLSVADRSRLMGDIASVELQKMGTEAETTGDIIAKMGADWENVTAEIGKATVEALKFFATVAQGSEGEKASTRAAIDDWAKHDAAVRDAYYNIQNAIADTSDKEAQLAAFREGRTKAEVELLKLTSKEQRNANEIALNLAQKRLDAAVGFNVIDQLAARENLKNTEKDIENQYRREQILKAVIDLYDKYINGPQKQETEATKEQIRNVFFLTAAIKALQEEHDAEGTSIERVLAINQELIPLQKELDELNGKQAKSTENLAAKLKELKERLSDLTTMTAKGIPGLRQFAVDGAGINNSLDTLNESLAQARKQWSSAPIGSTIFKQAQKDVEDLEAAIKRATNDQIDPAKGWLGVSSGIQEQATAELNAKIKAEQEYVDFLATSRNEALDILNAYADASMSIVSHMNAYETAIAEQRYAQIDRLVEKGLITEEEADKKRKRIAREQAKRNKEIAIFQSIVNTAMAVVNALATAPNFIVGAIMEAAAGVLGGIEIATIEATPLPSFGKGGFVPMKDGWIDGPKHTQGGVKLEAEGGEFIVNARQANKYADILESINRDRFDAEQVRGWAGLSRSIELNGMGGSSFNDMNLLSAIDRHRESETRVLRELLHEVKRSNGKPLRGGYHA